jgi:hypothetical protein
VPTPTFDQLVQLREDYVDSWNSGDKERFGANWRRFLADDDAFQMFDPVGTPTKRGLDHGTEVKSSSIENHTFTGDPQIHIRTWYVVPSGGPLAEQINEYLPDGGANSA